MYNTQTEAVMAHLERYGSITSMEAIYQYQITRLAVCISRLREKGYSIRSVPEHGVASNGCKTTYTRYVLEADNVQG